MKHNYIIKNYHPWTYVFTIIIYLLLTVEYSRYDESFSFVVSFQRYERRCKNSFYFLSLDSRFYYLCYFLFCLQFPTFDEQNKCSRSGYIVPEISALVYHIFFPPILSSTYVGEGNEESRVVFILFLFYFFIFLNSNSCRILCGKLHFLATPLPPPPLINLFSFLLVLFYETFYTIAEIYMSGQKFWLQRIVSIMSSMRNILFF